MDCMVCAYEIDGVNRLNSLVACGHSGVCHLCFLRIRSLQRTYHCPTCKRDLEHVICTNDAEVTFDSFNVWGDNIGANYIMDTKSRIFFPRDFYKSHIETLWEYRCKDCHETRRDMKQLRSHVINDHKKQICSLCIENKQVFPSEQVVYTQKQYEIHLKSGDNDGSKGHPSCEFCRKRYYDSAELFHHLYKDHFTCHICDKRGIKYRFFKQYDDLETHFRKDHYLCEEANCLERKFVVFSNDIELAAHNKQWHPHLHLINRTIPLHFRVNRGESQSSRHQNNQIKNEKPSADEDVSARRSAQYEGGLGGRVINGLWQVELEPSSTSADPRAADRNIDASYEETLYLTNNIQREEENRHMEGKISGDDLEEFPSLPTSSGGNGRVSNNKWVKLGNNNNGNKGKKNDKNDFPTLSSTMGKNGKIGISSDSSNIKNNNKAGFSRKANNSTGTLSDLSKDYAGLAETESLNRKLNLGNWGRIKEPSNNKINIVGNKKKTPEDNYEDDLARAIALSLNPTSTSTTYGTELPESPSYPILEREAVVPPPPVPNFDSGEDFPTLGGPSGGKLNVKSTGNSKKTSKKVGQDGWGDALKSAGIQGKKGKSKGLSVIKPSSSSEANKKLSAGRNGDVVAGRFYTGWVKLGGTGGEHDEKSVVSSVEEKNPTVLYNQKGEDFPSLGASVKKK